MKLVPRYCRNKTIWLPSDTAMVPPPMLVKHGVSLCHTVQEPGQFILVFPRAFTSSICTGYLVSESVYFAQPSWLNTAEQVFRVSILLEQILMSFLCFMREVRVHILFVLPIFRKLQIKIDIRQFFRVLGLYT
jgi:protein Jumonji